MFQKPKRFQGHHDTSGKFQIFPNVMSHSRNTIAQDTAYSMSPRGKKTLSVPSAAVALFRAHLHFPTQAGPQRATFNKTARVQAGCSDGTFRVVPHMVSRPTCLAYCGFCLFSALWHKNMLKLSKALQILLWITMIRKAGSIYVYL